MNEKSWLFRRPSLVIACAIYLAAAILIVTGGVYYHYANSILDKQREDLLDKTMHAAVQAISDELESVSGVAVSIRSRLRYTAMPVPGDMTAANRLELHDASALMRELLSPVSSVQEGYLFSPDAGYAITSTAVLQLGDLTRLYHAGGFSAAEMDHLHRTFSLGRLIGSENGSQMAFLLSIGKGDDGLPRRQLVLLLKRNALSLFTEGIELPEGSYTLINQLDQPVAQLMLGAMQEHTTTYRYPLDNGCTLQVTLNAAALHNAEASTRLTYAITVLLSLMVITAIAAAACRFNRIPINQMIDYIRRHYALPRDAQGGNLTVLRDAVEDIIENQSNAQYQLQERDEAQRWERLVQSLREGRSDRHRWQGVNYAMLVFMPHVTEQNALLAALQAAPQVEFALLPLRDGMAALIGQRDRALREDELIPLAESLLSAMDDAGMVLRAAVSACHDSLEEMHIAHREACMAADCLSLCEDTPVMRYQDCDFHTGSFRLDVEYLTRQQHFNRLVSQGKYDQAADCLPALISGRFQDEGFIRSRVGQMAFDMLKYQMMSCLDYLCTDTVEAIEIRRNAIRELLLCKHPQQVCGMMSRLLGDMALPESIADEDEDDETLMSIKQYVRTHFADPQLSVTSLAEPFGMTPNALSKFFSRKSGVGVLQYIHKIRIENACNLMLNTDLNLTEIAQRVGYTNNLTFSRAFKARYRMSPSEWRKMNEGVQDSLTVHDTCTF